MKWYLNHENDSNIITPSHFGFENNKSTEKSVRNLWHVFDLFKASDTINHNFLLLKRCIMELGIIRLVCLNLTLATEFNMIRKPLPDSQ